MQISNLVSRERQMVARRELQPGTETLFVPCDEAKGTVVMFHGYTAGPWQYKEMAARFHDAGYNVLAPRMPGHGCVDAEGVPTGDYVPNTGTQQQWDDFIDQSFQLAAGLGAPVWALGLSGGANVALRMGERHPEVKGVGAMAPYLGGNLPSGLPFRVTDVIDTMTFGLFGRILDLIPYHKNVVVPDDPTPHTQSSLGAAKVMRHVGADVEGLSQPVQLITTAGDKLSGTWKVGALARRCDEVGWYKFAASEGVPHAMVSATENPVAESVEKVTSLLLNFVESGKPASN